MLPAEVVIAIALVCLALAPLAFADDDPKGHFSVHPKTFVGKAGDCGPGYPAGAEIVSAEWIKGLGLPDNGGAGLAVIDNIDINGVLAGKQ